MTASVGKRRLKILFFSQRFPYPMDTGGKIRTGKLLEYLRQVSDLTLISNVESPKDDPYLRDAERLCSDFYPVAWKEVKKYSFFFYVRTVIRCLSRYPVTVVNDYSKDLESMLLQAIDRTKYDVVICDFLQPSINFRRVQGVVTLLFQHNVEGEILRRHCKIAKDLFTKLFWWTQWKKMMRFEGEMCRWFGGVVTVSDHDKRLIEQKYGARHVFAIPTGVDLEYFVPQDEPVKSNTLVFTGSMDWLPNEDALLYFANEILCLVQTAIPDVRISIVGRNPSKGLLKELSRHSNIEVVGWVKDVRPYISQHALYIIPLRIGGGTRIKAYEAMAMGKAVVSTSVGVEGLPVVHNEHVAIADTPETFASTIVELLGNSGEARRLGQSARRFVEQNFSWNRAGEVFLDICQKSVDKPQEARSHVQRGSLLPLGAVTAKEPME